MSKIDIFKTRFSGAEWYESATNTTAIVGGVGGIGSWLTMLLTRMGVELYIFDDDVIDEGNMGGQLYNMFQIGENKTSAIVCNCNSFTLNPKITSLGRYTKNSPSTHIMFSAFDNMEAREVMFNNWCKLVETDNSPAIFIDGRMLMEVGQIYCVTKNLIEDYKKTLFSSDEIDPVPCSSKSTSHCGAIMGGFMSAFFTNFLVNTLYKVDLRSVPFKFVYNLPVASFTSVELKTQNYG